MVEKKREGFTSCLQVVNKKDDDGDCDMYTDKWRVFFVFTELKGLYMCFCMGHFHEHVQIIFLFLAGSPGPLQSNITWL